MRSLVLILGLIIAAALGAVSVRAEDPFITVASTTSTENSGLFGHLLPLFKDETGIAVRVIAVGTGQAIEIARNGDADVLFVHHQPSERAFVAERYGVARHDVMDNDFVIVGPAGDPARIEGTKDAALALTRIAEVGAPFVSRGDDSGTHKKELSLWHEAGRDVSGESGTWYRETGAGMGATLNIAAGMDAYALTDRATWLKFGNKGALKILTEGDPRLVNRYGVVLVSPERHPHVKAELGQTFIDWLISDPGQDAIAAYRIDGHPAFFPNARPGSS